MLQSHNPEVQLHAWHCKIYTDMGAVAKYDWKGPHQGRQEPVPVIELRVQNRHRRAPQHDQRQLRRISHPCQGRQLRAGRCSAESKSSQGWGHRVCSA